MNSEKGLTRVRFQRQTPIMFAPEALYGFPLKDGGVTKLAAWNKIVSNQPGRLTSQRGTSSIWPNSKRPERSRIANRVKESNSRDVWIAPREEKRPLSERFAISRQQLSESSKDIRHVFEFDRYRHFLWKSIGENVYAWMSCTAILGWVFSEFRRKRRRSIYCRTNRAVISRAENQEKESESYVQNSVFRSRTCLSGKPETTAAALEIMEPRSHGNESRVQRGCRIQTGPERGALTPIGQINLSPVGW
jgi:hypothetical protein